MIININYYKRKINFGALWQLSYSLISAVYGHEKVTWKSFYSSKNNIMIRIINISARSKREVAALDWVLKMPEGISEDEFYIKYCPPLPPNFE